MQHCGKLFHLSVTLFPNTNFLISSLQYETELFSAPKFRKLRAIDFPHLPSDLRNRSCRNIIANIIQTLRAADCFHGIVTKL